MNSDQREFLKQAGSASARPPEILDKGKKMFFDISLAQFSFARDLFAGRLTTLDFPALAKNMGIDKVEYVAMFFDGKEQDQSFLNELKKRTDDLGVKNNLIMVDGENLADPDEAKRKHAVESHHPWVDAARFLGCHAIRVNLGGLEQQDDNADEVAKNAMDGYNRLLEYGAEAGIDIIVENHMGHSCNGAWLTAIMKKVNHPRAGVLPDLGNFCMKRTKPATPDLAGFLGTKCLQEYDKYKGVEELMPYAKGVSAKTIKFDASGNESDIDFMRMFTIIKKAGFKGTVGIEYAGGMMKTDGMEDYLGNEEGVLATKKLLEKVGSALS